MSATTTLSSRGQLVIPLEMRRKLGLSAGDTLQCEVDDGKIVLSREASEKATLMYADDGLPVLSAPKGAPEMTPELVKEILAE